MKAKKLLIAALALVMCLSVALSLCACNNSDSSTVSISEDPLWKTATHKSDVTLGEGKTTIQVDIVAGEKSITATINTDAITLEEALKSADLVEGEESEYGLFIKKVNGIEADFDKDQTYWAVSKDGEYMNSGVSTITIKSGEHYELKRTK